MTEASTGAAAAIAAETGAATSQPRKKIGLFVGVGVALITVAIAVVASVQVVRSRAAAASRPTLVADEPITSAAVPSASSVPAPATASATPEAGPSFDLEAVSQPVTEPTAQPVPADTSGLNYKTPDDPNKLKGKIDGGVPKGWKPPPVTDPGF